MLYNIGMKFNIRTVFLKSLPYLMSIAGGIILYTGAIDNAPNENLRDLTINVSASLLSIPLVFLLYDYTNSRIANQMKRTMINSMTDKLNVLMLNIIGLVRESMGVRGKLTTESLNRMLIWRTPEISKRLKITPRILEKLHEYHNDLDTLLFRNSQNSVLNAEQVQILSGLVRDMTHLINENKFRRNRHLSAKYTESMMGRILDWMESDNVAAMNLAQHISETTATTDKK
ncbi:MAG: hypothetical protein E7007_04590 [Alphaproteobacteria bacterium]|nr:hypothetical protein [Alphaproteobacteria bacterium]